MAQGKRIKIGIVRVASCGLVLPFLKVRYGRRAMPLAIADIYRQHFTRQTANRQRSRFVNNP